MIFLKQYSRLSKIKAQRAMTLIELLIIVAIIAVISSMAHSWYEGYIETAKVNTATTQIAALSLLIDDYILENGEPPEYLSDIGNAHLIDPWGRPYEYLKIALDYDQAAKNEVWMLGGGMMSVSMMSFSMVSLNMLSSSGKEEKKQDNEDRKEEKENDKDDRREEKKKEKQSDKNGNNGSGDNGSGNKGDGDNGGGNNGGGNNGGGNNGGGNNGGGNNGGGNNGGGNNGGEDSANGNARTDLSGALLNTDYDLFSMGKDGKSSPALPASVSQDDILRANNGGFIGLASAF